MPKNLWGEAGMDNVELTDFMKEWQKQMEPVREQLAGLTLNIDTSALRLAKADTAKMVALCRERYSDVLSQLIEFQATYNSSLRDMFAQIDEATSSFRLIMTDNAKMLQNISIPHISLYQNILKSIDFDKFQAAFDTDYAEWEDNDVIDDEEVKIVHPFLYDASVKINVYIAVTENNIHNNPNVGNEDKDAWNKYIKPVLNFLGTVFLTWALGNVPITDNMIMQQIEKVIEAIEDYHYPIETLDIETE
jgi:hypothetical protein